MLKKLLSVGLACLLTFIVANVQLVFAQQTTNQQSDTASALKLCVLHQRAGRGEPRIEVTLRNGQKLKGKIGDAEEDYFTILYHGNHTVVPYNEVASFKCGGTRNIGSEIGKAVVAVVAVAAAFTLLGVLIAKQTR
ncbi:MAG TPA: hypothetical protein VK619_11560 [Pyrinomonadaceae bacterium]|nr:hypothetical protein [Pyrinomonadaceae bacterium]